MKKFAISAVAFAAGALAAGSALAGSISLPAAPTTFAVEALAPATAVTTPTIQYKMGVGRPIGNGFTIIMTPSAGATFGTCVVPVYAGASTVSVTLKRQSTTECAYDVQVAGVAVAVNDTFTWTGQTFATHPLANKGQQISVSINLKDPGETSQVDNAGPITATIAQSKQSINIYAATSDTATVADVNATGGPLTGFVANATAPADTATTAAANLTFDHNSNNYKAADGVTAYAWAGGTVSLTLSGTNSGAAANKFCIDLNNNATLCEAGEVFTLSNATTSTIANVASGFPAQGATATRTVTFQADGTTQLGTSRTFQVSGTVTPALAGTIANAFEDTNGKNATAWVWSANASQLMTPYFTTDARFLSRYFFLNTGSADVGYTATCYAETGNAITYGAGKSGTLKGNAQTAVNAKDVCTFGGNTRGSVVFTINAPINTVKGSYQAVDPVSLNNSVVPMTRPYNQANTTE